MSNEVHNILIMVFGVVLAILVLVGGIAWIAYAGSEECDNGYVWYHTGYFQGCITLDDAMRLQSEEH